MGALWRMYTDRVCPVLPSWLAPYPYSPATFSDTLIGALTGEVGDSGACQSSDRPILKFSAVAVSSCSRTSCCLDPREGRTSDSFWFGPGPKKCY